MGIVAMQLDKLATAKSLRNASEIGRYLGVHRQTVSAWKKGDAYPEEDRIALMAQDVGENPGAWLAAVRAERSNGPAARAWADAAKRLATAAAVVLLLGGITAPKSSYASDFGTLNAVPSIHYAQWTNRGTGCCTGSLPTSAKVISAHRS